jgi:hypothetical protein
MKAFLRSAATVLTMLIAAAWISGCVIHAHHVDSDDKAKPAKKHKAKPAKKHKAKPPAEAEPAPAEPEDEGDAPKRHNPPTPPPPSNTL